MASEEPKEQPPVQESQPEIIISDHAEVQTSTQGQTHRTKRQRWATRRVKPSEGAAKRRSILDRFHKRSSSGNGSSSNDPTINADEKTDAELGEKGDPRTIYFNRSLPGNARDEDGRPLVHFVRNKIRTAKYTPLSFVPKNLWFQFHNVANIYFLFIIILSIFSIFGAANPGLNAVPLIVILFITAVKDGIEDFRRTVLDNELNNSPVHRLIDWTNVNTAEDKISIWRKFKKANTRLVLTIWRSWQTRTASKKQQTAPELEMEQARPSADTRQISIKSERTSFQSERPRPSGEEVELAAIPSPRISYDTSQFLSAPRSPYESKDMWSDGDTPQSPTAGDAKKKRISTPAPKRDYGTLVDPHQDASGKAKFKKDYWKNIQVGDFVRLYNEEHVPADIVVLSTSDPDGACYIETKNLDGETNLKVRQALHSGRKVRRAKDCERTNFYIESEPPHANLYQYSAVARWDQKNLKDAEAPSTQMAEPININNLLLRGCSVRNTEWVLGVVVFTGGDTKIMLNSGLTPSKRAKISRDLNWNVIYNFVVLFFMCLIAALVNGSYWAMDNTSVQFFEFGSYGGTSALNGFITFWAAIILFQNLVPISLYISLEIIRTAQAFFIFSDSLMYYEKVDYPCTPKSWNISDDLGQIEYIFSDKTGTLTQNVMEFKKATINGVPYGEAYTEAQAGMQKRQGINVEEEGAKAREQIEQDRVKMLSSLRAIHDNVYLRDEELTFVAPDFVNDIQGLHQTKGQEQKQANERFMLVLALCHTVITERIPGDPPKIEFKAQSPDEAALVATARDCGFTLMGRTEDGVIVNVQGQDVQYTVLNILEFNSSRKRMSAIIRMPDNKIMLFCKGADSVIYSRLKRQEQPEVRRATGEHLEMFAREGLRTLCIAERELNEQEYQEWNREHDLAAAAIEDRDEKLEKISDAIEQDLTLLGGTAIEDRLQDGVPDAIALLGNAGIKLWVLTGDKVETAINIGFSCNLLNNDMDLIILNVDDDDIARAEDELDKKLAMFGKTGSDEELVQAKKSHEPPPPTHAIVVDGDTLKLVLQDHLKQKFLLLCKQCKSVLCCRVSPSQKAAVVQMVKTGLDVITLSIGDGANDVAMIQEADVGVGIAGEEGRQAVMSSDFAIGQFRFLARLTLVHGRWCYRRLAEMIANFFYKNIVWTFALFWYNIYNNFDCSYVFDYTYILLYNLAFTSLPVIFQGILDQDVSDKVSLAVPQLYRRGIERKEWTQPKFWMYMFDGLYQSVICFFMVYLLFMPATFNTESGLNVDDNRRMGVYIASAAIIVVNLYILMNTYRWDWAMLGITAFSVLLVWFWTGVWTASTISFQFYKGAPEVYGALSFWAQLLLIVVVCLIPRFTAKSYQKIYRPRDVDIVREQVRLGKFDYLDDQDPETLIAAPKPLSFSSSDASPHKANTKLAEDERPIINAPSTSHTNYTRNPHSQQGSDDTMTAPPIINFQPPRPSFERMRSSMDRIRPSYEQSRDFSSAAYLSKVESSRSNPASPR